MGGQISHHAFVVAGGVSALLRVMSKNRTILNFQWQALC